MTPTETAMTWREKFTALSPHRPPCPGIAAQQWPEIRERALAFLEQYGAQAAELGWTAGDLFGVHPDKGTTRVDQTGALLLSAGMPIVAVTAETVRFERLTYYRNTPGRVAGVPVWEFRG